MSGHLNIVRIKALYDALEELADHVAFVGGATVSLYSDRPATDIRPTEDVDIVIELADYKGYAGLEDKLRKKGFVNDVASGVICRYLVKGIIVDVMPTAEEILGFANRWYREGYATAISRDLGEGYTIRIFHPVYFLAAKLEAFKDRGGGDGRISQDFEDIVSVLNNRSRIWDEMHNAPEPVKSYLKESFQSLLAMDDHYEWISAHLDFLEQRRADHIIGGLITFVESVAKEK
jgi:predicted nucleotidyltransferase